MLNRLANRTDMPDPTHKKDCSIAGAILAGGAALRIGGIAKGAMQIDGTSIIERTITQMARAGICDTVIVANTPGVYDHCGRRIIRDRRTGIGPLAGIEAALMHYCDRCDAVLFLPCDLPKITATEISALIRAYINGDAPIVFAAAQGFFGHQLCAVVSSDLAPGVTLAIDQGERRVRRVWRRYDAQPVPFANEEPFFNINTRDDMKAWRNMSKVAN